MRTFITMAYAIALSGSLGAESPSPAPRLPFVNDAGARVQANAALPAPTYQADVDTRIAEALVRARDENRRVLVPWGSNSDKASQALIQTMLKNSDVAHTLLYEYEIVRTDVAGNDRVAATYNANLQAGGLPYLTVLDADRNVLANQPVAPFRTEGVEATAYDGKNWMIS